MTASDIEPMDIVTFRNGYSCIVSECEVHKINMLFNLDLTSKMSEDYDIVSVQRDNIVMDSTAKIKSLAKNTGIRW